MANVNRNITLKQSHTEEVLSDDAIEIFPEEYCTNHKNQGRVPVTLRFRIKNPVTQETEVIVARMLVECKDPSQLSDEKRVKALANVAKASRAMYNLGLELIYNGKASPEAKFNNIQITEGMSNQEKLDTIFGKGKENNVYTGRSFSNLFTGYYKIETRQDDDQYRTVSFKTDKGKDSRALILNKAVIANCHIIAQRSLHNGTSFENMSVVHKKSVKGVSYKDSQKLIDLSKSLEKLTGYVGISPSLTPTGGESLPTPEDLKQSFAFFLDCDRNYTQSCQGAGSDYTLGQRNTQFQALSEKMLSLSFLLSNDDASALEDQLCSVSFSGKSYQPKLPSNRASVQALYTALTGTNSSEVYKRLVDGIKNSVEACRNNLAPGKSIRKRVVRRLQDRVAALPAIAPMTPDKALTLQKELKEIFTDLHRGAGKSEKKQINTIFEAAVKKFTGDGRRKRTTEILKTFYQAFAGEKPTR